MADIPKIYWDACMWIALIKREKFRFEACLDLVERAQRGEVKIWTSAFTLAEVWKPYRGESGGLPETDDRAFEDYIEQDFVTVVQVDTDIGVAARRLLRRCPIKKPQDAVHLATALVISANEMHTFDKADLLKLDDQLLRSDGQKLRILAPTPPPHPDEGTLLEPLIDRTGTI